MCALYKKVKIPYYCLSKMLDKYGYFYTTAEYWSACAKFTESVESVESTTYITAEIFFLDDDIVEETLRGKLVYIRTAVTHNKHHIVLADAINGFMVCAITMTYEHLHESTINALKQVIGSELLPLYYDDDDDDDDSYNYVYPNSSIESLQSWQITQLADKMFLNIVNMEKINTLMPDLPLDIQRLIVDKMRPTVPDCFQKKEYGTVPALNIGSRSKHRKLLRAWLGVPKTMVLCASIKMYLDEIYEDD